MGEAEEVKVFGVDYSAYSLRVEIALKLKGIEYEFVEEDLLNKSEELLKYNPIHKKVPVFIHQGRVLAESLVILEYIDETWKNGYDIMPSDPYERAHVRFWANFIDDKLMTALGMLLRAQESEKEKAREELKELITIFQNEVKGKNFLGGNKKIGCLDIASVVAALWMPVLLEAIDENFLTHENFPGFCTWADHLLSCDIVKQKVPNREKLVQFYRVRIPLLLAKHVHQADTKQE